MVVVSHTLDGQRDHFRRHFQAAIHGTAQCLGLHHGQTQVVAIATALRGVVPAAVFALGIGDQLQSAIQHRTDPRVVGHPVGLAEHECRQPVVVHVPATVGDVQQPRGLGVAEDVVQRTLHCIAVFATAGRMSRRQKGQRAHPDQPQVIGLPIPLAALVLGQPLQPQVQRAFALGGDLPFPFRTGGTCDQRKANQCQQDLPGHFSHRSSRSVRPGSPDDVDYPINSGSHLDRRYGVLTDKRDWLLGENRSRSAYGCRVCDDASSLLSSPASCTRRGRNLIILVAIGTAQSVPAHTSAGGSRLTWTSAWGRVE